MQLVTFGGSDVDAVDLATLTITGIRYNRLTFRTGMCDFVDLLEHESLKLARQTDAAVTIQRAWRRWKAPGGVQ